MIKISIIDWLAKLQGKEPKEVCKEWHSWWVGWAEMVSLRIPPRFPMTDHTRLDMKENEHYYHIGRAIGTVTAGVLIGIFAVLVF